jgi:hypothetical protein
MLVIVCNLLYYSALILSFAYLTSEARDSSKRDGW